MLNAKLIFDQNFIRIGQIDAIYIHSVHDLGLTHEDVADLLRSEVVYAISAIDRLVHELVKKGMVSIFLGARPITNSYSNFQLTLSQHNEIRTPGPIPPEAVFQSIIELKHGYLAFQDPDKMKEALNFIWNEQFKWQKIAAELGSNETTVKQTLNNIVIRRNQIVHEMDLNLSTGVLQPLSYADSRTMVDFIQNLGNAIYNLVI